MKNLLQIGLLGTFALVIQTCARSADYFVSPTGSDDNSGAIESPFATVQRAQAEVVPGSTVYLRGGTYRMQESQIARRKGIFAYLTFLDKDGESGKPITYRPYQNERPVFDCSLVKPEGMRVDAFYVSGSWLRIQGLEVTRVQVTIKKHTQSICFENNGSHNLFEGLRMHDGQAIGIYSVRGSNNLFLNCDAWNNWDYTSEDGRGGNVDGFGCHPTKGSTGNVFRGCRAWFNSDDGYDCISAYESVVFEHCWAMYNGYSPTRKNLGDGNGFKAGGFGSTSVQDLPEPIPRHTIRFCVAVGNKNSGFYSNHHLGGNDWFHNTAFRNGMNFNMLNRLADNRTDVDGFGHKLRNNLSFNSRTDIAKINMSQCDTEHNSFTLGIHLKDSDFENMDESELTQSRQTDGELPSIRFLRPKQNSLLIDQGVDVGLPFQGLQPDLGALER